MLPHHILIPCKALSEGKSRLSGILPADARFDLCASLLERTLTLARDVAAPAHIHLITADEMAVAVARPFGVSVVADRGGDLNAALAQGRDHVMRRHGDAALLILPIDLPFADAAAVSRMETGCEVSLAGDSARSGSNALALSGKAARDFGFGFGEGSFARHRETAEKSRYSLAIVDDPALAFDLDGPDDYRRAVRSCLFKTAELVP